MGTGCGLRTFSFSVVGVAGLIFQSSCDLILLNGICSNEKCEGVVYSSILPRLHQFIVLIFSDNTSMSL